MHVPAPSLEDSEPLGRAGRVAFVVSIKLARLKHSPVKCRMGREMGEGPIPMNCFLSGSVRFRAPGSQTFLLPPAPRTAAARRVLLGTC